MPTRTNGTADIWRVWKQTGCYTPFAPMPGCPWVRQSRWAAGSNRKTGSARASCGATSPATSSPPARNWPPFYTIHKIMAGMFDMYRLAGNQQALQVLEGMSTWADEWTSRQTEEHMQQILTVEFGGIAETLYSLAAATGNDRWAKVGDRFQKKSFINPLASRRDELRGLHVNTHVPQVRSEEHTSELQSLRHLVC